ncbi:hypothetical protein [Chitinophaga eiseniae]|uniref:Chaperone of endosialidase n=1 Tax=Chitinophaga eiseniae TaxID=634771 RepID=A0A847SPE4_9BACT|nr:hypothetical protein [Chitinophaga eiseniae]NLR82134.1 hypothetical protein [Chitinophaga eiseniae]
MKCIVSLVLSSFFCLHVMAQNKLESTGNAGIGTINPATKLEIYSDGLSNIQLTHQYDVLGNVGALKFNMAGTEVGKLEVERTIASNRQSVMKFSIKGRDSLMEAMRIFNNGFVGIGERSPDARLTVSGDSGTYVVKFTQRNVPATDASLSVRNATSATGVFIPNLIGRSSIPGRSFGLYITGEAEDVLPASDASVAAVILDGRTKTSTRLTTNNVLAVNSAGVNLMQVKGDGSVGIGTTDTKGYKLAVNGSGVFTKVVVKAYNNWPDFVFEHDYQLPTLGEMEAYVRTHKHLPEIPSAAEVAEKGVDLGEMNQQLLKKVEEQLLYMIEMNKKITSLTQEVQELKKKIAQ